jgi:hypothetical protein
MKTRILRIAACAQIIFAACQITGLAQTTTSKPNLTKEETIRYIDKKVKETVGLWYFSPTAKQRLFVEDSSIVLNSDGSVRVFQRRSDQTEDNCKQTLDDAITFDPATISSIEFDPVDSSSRGAINIKLTGKSGRVEATNRAPTLRNRETGRCYNYVWERSSWDGTTTDSPWIPFLKSDPTNFEKLKKALLHLRDLAKAEDDPFSD